MRRILIVLGAVLIANGCGDDRPPASGGGDRPPPIASPPTPESDAAVVVEAGDGEIGPALCQGLEQKSQEVEEYTVPGAAPPPTGGDIELGVYVLNELDAYGAPTGAGTDPPPPGPTGKLARSTLYVTAKTMQFLDGDVARAFTYERNGTELELVGVCPTQDTTTRTFSFSGNLLTFDVDASHTEVYRILR